MNDEYDAIHRIAIQLDNALTSTHNLVSSTSNTNMLFPQLSTEKGKSCLSGI